MTDLAYVMWSRGWTLRSGGAQGADQAFEKGTTRKQSFKAVDAQRVAQLSVAWYHPVPHAMGSYGKLLMARNLYQVTGLKVEEAGITSRDDLRKWAQDNPNMVSRAVICWTPDGAYNSTSIRTGGTGQAIRIAIDLGIPVFNLAHHDHLNMIQGWIAEWVDEQSRKV